MTVRILLTQIKRPDPFSAAFPEDAVVRIVLGAERARQEGLRAAAEDELLDGDDGLSRRVFQHPGSGRNSYSRRSGLEQQS